MCASIIIITRARGDAIARRLRPATRARDDVNDARERRATDGSSGVRRGARMGTRGGVERGAECVDRAAHERVVREKRRARGGCRA